MVELEQVLICLELLHLEQHHLQQNILLVYPFSDVVNLELDITDGLNPTRIIFLCLKDGRRIPLTPSNQLNDLLFLEGRAIFIAKLLKVDLKLNNR